MFKVSVIVFCIPESNHSTVDCHSWYSEWNECVVFNVELDNDHYDAQSPVDEKQILGIPGKVSFYRLYLVKHFL